MALIPRLGTRFLLRTQGNRFLSVITILSVLGVMTGVASLVVVLSVMAGFESDLESKIIGFDAHLTLTKPNGIVNPAAVASRVREIPKVDRVQGMLEGEVLAMRGAETRGAILRGVAQFIGTGLEPAATSFQGSCLGLTMAECFESDTAEPVVVAGAELAADLRYHADPERRLEITSPQGLLGPFGFEPRQQAFRIQDTFRSGFYETDTRILLTSLSTAQHFFQSPDQVSSIAIWAKSPDDTASLKRELHRLFSGEGFVIRTWEERNQRLFSALKLEKLVMFLVLLLVVLVASFVIVVTLSLLISEKVRALAVLRTIGLTQKRLAQIFLFDGALIGAVGSGLGFLIGLGLCFALDRYHFVELPAQYYITTIPIRYEWWNYLVVGLAAIALAMFASVAPAKRAAGLNPIEGLRDG